jgi:hypothetical protein
VSNAIEPSDCQRPRGQVHLVAVGGEPAVQRVQRQQQVVRRLPLQRRGDAQALLLGVPGREAVAVGEDQVAGQELGLLRGAQLGDVRPLATIDFSVSASGWS